jgi:hypothetical protein
LLAAVHRAVNMMALTNIIIGIQGVDRRRSGGRLLLVTEKRCKMIQPPLR